MYQYLEPTDMFDFMDKLKAFMTETISPAWEVLRWNDTREVDGDIEFWAANTGFTGQDKVVLGFKTYRNVTDDIYNIRLATCTAFNAGEPFASQVNFLNIGACSLNLPHPVWLCGDARHIRWVTRLAASYFTFFAGLYIPYQPQMIQPYYLALGGNNGGYGTRYSSVRTQWINTAADRRVLIPSGWVTNTTDMILISVTSGLSVYDKRLLAPISMRHSQTGVLGQFPGVYFTTGFSALPEDVLQSVDITGTTVDFLLVPNLSNRAITDYSAFELR